MKKSGQGKYGIIPIQGKNNDLIQHARRHYYDSLFVQILCASCCWILKETLSQAFFFVFRTIPNPSRRVRESIKALKVVIEQQAAVIARLSAQQGGQGIIHDA